MITLHNSRASQDDKRIVHNKTFALLFAANGWAPFTCSYAACVHCVAACTVHVLPDARDTARHDFFLCQNAW